MILFGNYPICSEANSTVSRLKSSHCADRTIGQLLYKTYFFIRYNFYILSTDVLCINKGIKSKKTFSPKMSLGTVSRSALDVDLKPKLTGYILGWIPRKCDTSPVPTKFKTCQNNQRV